MKKLLLSFGCLLGTLISNGQCVGALDLPSSSDYVQFVNPFYSYTNEITVEGWVYMDGTMNSTPWIGQATAGLDNMGTNVWHWHGAGANELSWQVNDNGTWRGINSTTMTNGWHHVATVADNASVRVYIDGVLNATGPGISGAMISNSNSEIHIGHDVRFAAGTGGRNGDYKIGELRVWNVARTQTEIAANMSSCLTGSEMGLKLYNKLENGIGGTATSAVGPNGSLVNMNTTTSWVMGSGSECCTPAAALNFDGVDDYVSAPNQSILDFGTGDFTIEANFKSSVSQPNYTGVVSKAGSGANVGVQVVLVNNRIAAEMSNGSTGFGVGNGLIGTTVLTDGNWHHLAMVVTRSLNQVQLLVDGNVEATLINGAISGLNVNSSADLLIGTERTYGIRINGNLDEVRLWNVARTRCDIISYKNCEIPTTASGLVANYHFNEGVDAGSNASVTSLADASGNSNNGTLTNFALIGTTSNWVAPGAVISGSITPVVCPLASALNFDGSNDIINIPGTVNATDLGISAFTLEAWIYLNSSSGAHSIIRKSGDYSFYVYNGNLGAEVWPLGTSNSSWKLFSGSAGPAINQWTHVAFTWNGTIGTLYVNGSEIPSTTTNGNISVSENLYLGASSVYGDYLNGSLDEVRIWNTSRTNCELISYMNCEIPTTATGLVANYHFNQGFASYSNSLETILMDASGNSYNGSLNNFALTGTTSNWIAPGGVISGSVTPAICNLAASLNFDGIDDYVSIDYVAPTTDITHEFWFNTTQPNQGLFAVTNGNPNPSGNDRELYLENGNITAYIWQGGPTEFISSSGIDYADGNWHHIAHVIGASVGGQKVYVDGLLVASGSFASSAFNWNNKVLLGFSAAVSTNNYFNGLIDNVRLWNVTRTQCEINTYMNCEIPTTATGLVANYHFNQGVASFSNPTQSALMDASGNSNTGVLNNFALNGSTSNWVAPGGVVNGYTTTLAPSTITVNSGAICVGQSFTMTPSGAATFTYSNGSDVAMPTADATYTVSGTAVSGCPAIDAIASVTVNSLPVIVSETGSVTVCGDATGTFSLVANNTSTYSWQYQFNSGSISLIDGSYGETGYTTAVMQIPTLESEGWDGYDITCLLTSTEGCTVVSSPKLITVNALPTVTVSSGTICSGESFTMTPGGAITYTYSNGSNVVMPTADDTYTVTGTDVNGCENTAVSSLTVNALPTLSVSSTSTLICTGETATLSVTGASTYTWSTNETTSDIAVNPTTQSTYTVNATDGNGCVNSTTILQDVSLCTGLANNSTSINLLSIFPNPNNGMFTVKSDMDLNLNLTNALGQVIQTIQLNDLNNHEMNIDMLSNGVYFITGQNNNKSVKQKVIVTK
ncbi:MAG: LamG-like jellyroll fold domain-containing protein [Bacteroidota bacterium]